MWEMFLWSEFFLRLQQKVRSFKNTDNCFEQRNAEKDRIKESNS